MRHKKKKPSIKKRTETTGSDQRRDMKPFMKKNFVPSNISLLIRILEYKHARSFSGND